MGGGTGMNIDVYVMVHNEEFILPYFLRHYGSFARKIYTFEDKSTDHTREIILSCPKVHIIEPEIHGINEKYWTSVLWPMYEQYSKDADWVIQVDADEFVYHPHLLSVLKQEKEQGTQMIFCKGYTMLADNLPMTQEQIYDEIRKGLPDRWSSKWVIFDPTIRLRYGDGRHKVIETSATKLNSHTGIKILHYRYLGKQYFEDRDIRNRKRFNIVDKVELEYSPTRRHNLPDGTRGVKLDWYAENKSKAVDVVDT